MPFNIRHYVEFDPNGRGDCPCCLNMGYKPGEKTLSLMENGAYHCYRDPDHKGDVMKAIVGYTSDRDVPEYLRRKVFKKSEVPQKKPATLYTLDKIEDAKQRLLQPQTPLEQKALEWLLRRGLTRDLIDHYNLGYGKTTILDDRRQKHWLSGVALFIPTDQAGKFYRKLRVAPWLAPEEQPEYYRKWSQAGIPSRIWLTYHPPDAQRTLMCEGEWDALALGWLARQEQADFAVACSTTGAATVPSPAQLQKLPGEVIIFYDRNDPPSQTTGRRPGDEGALKLALALSGRGRIAEVPCSEASLHRQGWDVSNAIEAGQTIADFQVAAYLARLPEEVQHLQQMQTTATEATAFREAIAVSALRQPNPAPEAIEHTILDNATQQEVQAWKTVRAASPAVYQSSCPESTQYAIASDIGDAMRTLYRMISTHSPDLAFFLPTPMNENAPNLTLQTMRSWFILCQAMATPRDQLTPIHQVQELLANETDLPPSTLDDLRRDWQRYQQQLVSLVTNCRYILEQQGVIESTGDRVYAGKTYEIRETPAQTLTLTHRQRGMPLEINASEIVACQFTQQDVQLVSLQAQRIEQTLNRLPAITPVSPDRPQLAQD